ncbi:EF-hand calcium-binding domain-containing protein 11 [Aythya fuligula]|uniref:EF-hand calcium-binding domain-containing protein 11 n=1 Tax=Aythya fuligula TaxID=219594 RepID=A0A6J3D3J8_AYTFU|nr:EF-hand calcium-binding domain-containing protein 11 [Aythya fuligula]
MKEEEEEETQPQLSPMPLVFEVCGEDNKGYLSREEFKVAVVLLFSYKPSKVEVDAVMSSVKPENSGILFEKFLDLMSARKAAQLYNSETWQIFTAFDVQSRGFLTFEDFKKTFDSVSSKLPESVIPEAFRPIFFCSICCPTSEGLCYQASIYIEQNTQMLIMHLVCT